MTDCIFCKIISGDIPNHTVYEDEHVLAFLNIKPVAKGHVLVISKSHAQTLPEVSAIDVVHVFQVVRKLDARLREALGCDAVSVLIRDGPAAGQEVPHMHVHLIPRYDDDELGPGYHEGEQVEAAELKVFCEEFKKE